MDERLSIPFVSSAKDIITQMSGIEIQQTEIKMEQKGEIESLGITSVINFSGKIKGRLILDLSPNVSLKIVEGMMGEPQYTTRDRMFLAAISEINNIIAGDANTVLNNKFALSLRLAPPIIFCGTNVVFTSPKIQSQSIFYDCEHGKLKINIGFQGGVGWWMLSLSIHFFERWRMY